MPLQGICQGNGGSPALHMAISIVLVKVLREKGFMAVFVRAISGVKIDIAVIIFVDDTDLINVARLNEPVPHILARTQSAMDTWHGSL